MQISVDDAKSQPVRPTPEEKRALINNVRAMARARASAGPDAARSQDFLYEDDDAPKR
jgi:hypothetical protein